MTVRTIIEVPDPQLRELSMPVETFDQDFSDRLDDLIDTFAETKTIGLSAPQIGYRERFLVMDLTDDRSNLQIFVNPEIVKSAGFAIVEESCASVPDVKGNVMRSAQILLRACDREGKPFEVELSNMDAVCVQHEIDHLDGKLFIDRLPFWRRWFLKAS